MQAIATQDVTQDVYNNAYQDLAAWPSGSRYSVDQKIAVLSVFASTGNVQEVARQTQIPDGTIQWWKQHAPWWNDHVKRIQVAKNDEVDGMITANLEAASSQVSDRIENGDEIITKDGEKYRRKMGGRDLATVFGILFDKRQIIRNLPTSIKQESTSQRLGSLAERLESLENIQSRTIEGDSDTIDDDSSTIESESDSVRCQMIDDDGNTIDEDHQNCVRSGYDALL